MPDLAIVIPIYNESANIGALLREWGEALDAVGADYRFITLNDGSKDNTAEVLASAATELGDRIDVVNKANSGHGRTCRFGYERALAADYPWILQIDSDGQCDPIYFADMWAARDQADCVFGLRVTRDDGLARAIISRMVRLSTFCLTGRDLRDANVPYRLMRHEVLARALKRVPADFDIHNVALTLALKRDPSVRWHYVPIRFRDRQGGTNSIDVPKIFKMGWNMLRALRGVS
ncbi:glycosyltransferase family 2 protein [Actomonas aquatica]|uniref:Glycosyltransferase family 2 protein n=1 Tax=Actomonas aquatica TaxID=2866162 RepID=A0ABZ1C9Y0_9BACT|nr:glycosyltransferase family 2 protein [Opitutus sp. WL0086]WRQ88496.1 glycosyltransferase family 2 protein [Opitutus sp. WL0086]